AGRVGSGRGAGTVGRLGPDLVVARGQRGRQVVGQLLAGGERAEVTDLLAPRRGIGPVGVVGLALEPLVGPRRRLAGVGRAHPIARLDRGGRGVVDGAV